MLPLEERARLLRLWLRRADSDLRFSAYGRAQSEDRWGACYHAQQAAEKALKGYLAWLGESAVPYTHDLSKLADLIARQGGTTARTEALAVLQDYSVGPRYPQFDDPTQQEAEAAYALAAELVAFVREQARSQSSRNEEPA